MATTPQSYRKVLSTAALAFCLALAASPLVVLANPTGTPASGTGSVHPGVTSHEGPGSQWGYRSASAQATLCNNASPASLQYDQLMDPMGQSSSYDFNPMGASYAYGGPTLMSLYGYGKANLASWWTQAYLTGAAFNPVATCTGAPEFLYP